MLRAQDLHVESTTDDEERRSRCKADGQDGGMESYHYIHRSSEEVVYHSSKTDSRFRVKTEAP